MRKSIVAGVLIVIGILFLSGCLAQIQDTLSSDSENVITKNGIRVTFEGLKWSIKDVNMYKSEWSKKLIKPGTPEAATEEIKDLMIIREYGIMNKKGYTYSDYDEASNTLRTEYSEYLQKDLEISYGIEITDTWENYDFDAGNEGVEIYDPVSGKDYQDIDTTEGGGFGGDNSWSGDERFSYEIASIDHPVYVVITAGSYDTLSSMEELFCYVGGTFGGTTVGLECYVDDKSDMESVSDLDNVFVFEVNPSEWTNSTSYSP